MLRSAIAALRFGLLALLLLHASGCSSPEDRAQGHYERGMKLLAQNEYLKASLEFRNALQLKKDLVGAWRGLAQIEERNRNWESLIAIRQAIVELDPSDIEAKLQLALLLTRTNALDQALTLVNAAEQLDTPDARLLGAKAVILLRLNDARGAVREAQAALKIDPANGLALLVLAAERLARGDGEGALGVLDRSPVTESMAIAVPLFKIRIFEPMGK